MLLKSLASLFCVAGAALLSQAVQAGAVSDVITVNTYLPGHQMAPGVVSSPTGEKLIAWRDETQNTYYLQRIDTAGVLSPNKMLLPFEQATAIATARSGNFIVVSRSQFSAQPGYLINLYDRNGNLISAPIRYSTNPNAAGGVSIAPNGSFVAVYSEPSPLGYTLFMKRYTATGTQIGYAIPIAQTTNGALLGGGGVAFDDAGNMTVTWMNILLSVPDVWMRRFDASGTPTNTPATVHSNTAGTQTGGSIAMNSSGNFVIGWCDNQPNTNIWNAYVQRYNVLGHPVNDPIRLNATDLPREPSLSVAMMDDGSFVATWNTDSAFGAPPGKAAIKARQFRSDGTPAGNEFYVSPPDGDSGEAANVAMDMAGNFVVGWQSYNAVTGYDAKIRAFKMDTLPPTQILINGQTVQGISGATDSWKYFKITVPAGTKNLSVNMTGSQIGDGDVYFRWGGYPTLSKWEIRPALNGNNEAFTVGTPPAGDFYIAIHGYSAYTSNNLTVRYW
ncbi:PPC domain-containing protein [Undibacterium umbellatum]|uniref:PPC domain-containing protein n=1 Tax=Undibacterium umbellatum TaxID=2762300 RepID=A0ABR6ZFW8_9BURK|nr:PPC domain-containing protein [Undibacterium umbellatum]MBC3910623.1 PPC domain-containing protein [Undibacterium umbellatum]